jgi:two-component system heavy metal sensor histidine kinase CusS
VVSKLLNNAIQYSPAGAKLRVEMRRQSDSVQVAVCNPGEAIPTDHLTRRFDRFYRIDSSRSSSTDNHGHVLAIVKAIVKMHGGQCSRTVAAALMR